MRPARWSWAWSTGWCRRARPRRRRWSGRSKLAEQPQAALQITRELIDRSAEMSLAGSLAAERLAQGMLAHSADSYRADR